MTRPDAQEREMITSLLSGEMHQTGTMYLEYPEGYNQRVADTNNRLYDEFVLCQFTVVTPAAARILVDTGLAQAISRG